MLSETPWLLWLAVAGFMCGILYTLISIATISKTSKKPDMVGAITTIFMVNGALCLTLAGTGYFSVNSIQLLKRPYVFIILHAAIIFAIIGFGVSMLRQLGVDPSSMKPSSTSAPSTTKVSDSDAVNAALGIGSTGFALGIISVGVLIYLWRKGKFN